MLWRRVSTASGQKVPKADWLYRDSASPLTRILCELLGKPRRPPVHTLSFELLAYIASPTVSQSFPLSTHDFPFHRNLTLFHFSLLSQRLLYEETRTSLAMYYDLFDRCDKYVFERYLDLVEGMVDVPVAEFESTLVEMMAVKFSDLEKSVACYGYNRPYLVISAPEGYNLTGVIHREVFEQKVHVRDVQVRRLEQYFVRQKEYLEGLSFCELTENRVDWGKGLEGGVD